MAQRMNPKFGAGGAALGGLVLRELPEAAAAAYGGTGTGTDRLVLLAKPLRAGAGYVYVPLAVVPLQDLPEHLCRQVQVAAGAGGQGAGAAAAGTNADDALAAAPLQPPHPVVPEPLRLRLRQLAGGPNGEVPTIELSGEGASDGVHDYSQRRVLRLMADEGGKAVYLDASGLHELIDVTTDGAADTELGAFYDTGLAAPENADDGDMPARDNGVPVVVVLLQLCDPGAFDYFKSPPKDAAPFTETTLLGDGRAAEQGARRYYDVLLPPPENLMPAVAWKASRGSLSPTYPVQVNPRAPAGLVLILQNATVSVDAGAKAGDPIAVVGVKGAAGAEAGRGRGGLTALVGFVAASSAATALAAGAAGPVAVTAFGLFAVLVGGLSLAMAGVVAGV